MLKGISGFALPGTMTALMGSTGAGKTTLMDVIAARKTGGHTRGKIFINGHEATDLVIRRCAGYCEQMNIHSESSTFREALAFSAFLRQGADVPDSQKLDSVNECLELLELESIADQIIRGSSMEQMKRLTIGVELAAQPSVLFLDEPTSGLDARSAKLVMDGVRKVANTGRTIICTIHQPSSEVFRLFDSLLLLKRGGETVFFGELGSNAIKLVNYFESIPGVPRIKSDYNPATWMLEVIGAGVNRTDDASKDFVSVFNSSPQKQMLDQCLAREGVTRPSPSLAPLEFGSKRAASNLTQFKWILQRFARMYWRTPSYNITRTIVSIVLALLHGLLYVSTTFTTYQGINAGVGLLSMTIMFVGYLSFSSVMPLMCEERASFYRERASQTYNAFWYFVGCSLIEIPYVALNSLLFTLILFPLVGFTEIDTLLLIWLNMATHVLLQTYVGQLMAFSLPTIEIASILGVLLNCNNTLFIGFNPPTSAMPSAYKWIKAITPQSFTLAIVSSLLFGDCPENGDGSAIGCQVLTGTPPTVAAGTTAQQYLAGAFHMKKSDMWTNFGIELLFIVVFRIAALITMRYVNHKRS